MALTQGSPLPNITTTQGQTTTAPSWYTDYLSNLAGNVTNQTTGPNAAQYVGAQPLQTQAFQAVGALPGTYQPMVNQAAGLASGVGEADVAGNVSKYMTPYTANVVDALGDLGKRNINQFLAPAATSGAVGAGQFGSKRGAEVLGQAINSGLQNLNLTQAQALQTGYTQALTAAQQEQANKLGAASQLGNLATTGQNLNLADINALSTMGGQQQTIAQNEQLFPLQTLNTGAAALRGYQVPTSVNSTYNGPIPGAYSASPLQQIAGIGALLSAASTSASGAPTSFGNWLGGQLTSAGSGIGSLFSGNSSTPELLGGGGTGTTGGGITTNPDGSYTTSTGDTINQNDYSTGM
jgi:hypothetical protein